MDAERPTIDGRMHGPFDCIAVQSAGEDLRSPPMFKAYEDIQCFPRDSYRDKHFISALCSRSHPRNRSRCDSNCSTFSDGAESLPAFDSRGPFSPGHYTRGEGAKRSSIGDMHNFGRSVTSRDSTPDTEGASGSYRGRAATISVPSAWTRRSSQRAATCAGNGLRNAPGIRASKFLQDGIYHAPAVLGSNRDGYYFDYQGKASKKVHTEQVISKHALKGKLSKFQRLIDQALELVNSGDSKRVVEGAHMVAKIMINAWMSPNIGRDLANGLCDYLRTMGYFDTFLDMYLNDETQADARQACGRVLEDSLTSMNRHYIATSGNKLERLVNVVKQFNEGEPQRVAVSILEDMFKDSYQTNARLVDMSALDFTLNACQATSNSCSVDNVRTLRHAAQALANLSMYSDHSCQQRMIEKKVPDWLFLLASSQDDVTRYYACLSVCALVANKEIEASVIKSGTLTLVEPFLLAHQPQSFASFEYKHCQGRPAEWLAKLIPLLNTKRQEPRALAAFHFAMEAGIKKDQELLGIFEDIGAVEALKQVAALPEEVAPKFAGLVLQIIGEEVPYKLTQQVPLWSVTDVQYWVTQIGFRTYADTFAEQMVDGDLLLLLTDCELENDIGMQSALMRKRFMRELDSLKIAADYSCVDEKNMDRFLCSIDPKFSIYTYRLLDLGIDCSVLFTIGDDMLKNDCGISNSVHRQKLIHAIQGCKDAEDIELAVLSKQIDVFISYRRSTGSQLASLLKVLLQLQGYKVFIDIDRLYAGKFDCSLLKNVQAAKHFILVLTQQALDRCLDDDEGHDWVHREITRAIQHHKNIIPIFDPEFEWPDESRMPADIRVITKFNGVQWVHEYQDACIAKLEKFITGQINVHILPKTAYGSRSQSVAQSCFSVGSHSHSVDLDDTNDWIGTQRSRANTNENLSKTPILSAKVILESRNKIY